MTGVTGDLNATPKLLAGNPNRPVETVSWDDIQVFLSRLNAQQAGNISVGWAYVLPTEAQWEYACRAGTTTVYSWGDSIILYRQWDFSNTGEYFQTLDVGHTTPTRGAFLICTAMYGSGLPIGMRHTAMFR